MSFPRNRASLGHPLSLSYVKAWQCIDIQHANMITQEHSYELQQVLALEDRVAAGAPCSLDEAVTDTVRTETTGLDPDILSALL